MCGVSNLVIETPNSFELPSNDEFLFYIKKPDPDPVVQMCQIDVS